MCGIYVVERPGHVRRRGPAHPGHRGSAASGRQGAAATGDANATGVPASGSCRRHGSAAAGPDHVVGAWGQQQRQQQQHGGSTFEAIDVGPAAPDVAHAAPDDRPERLHADSGAAGPLCVIIDLLFDFDMCILIVLHLASTLPLQPALSDISLSSAQIASVSHQFSSVSVMAMYWPVVCPIGLGDDPTCGAQALAGWG